MAHRLKLLFAAGIAVMALGAPSAKAQSTPPLRPTLVELFTAQGCAASAAAHAQALTLAGRQDLLVLTFPVDYWDYLGWPDSLARPDFSARQRAYVRSLRSRSVYTPQMVVNGAVHGSGARPESVANLLAQQVPPSAGPTVQLNRAAGHVSIRVGPKAGVAEGADVWLVHYTPGVVEVAVAAGDNRGRALPHVNPVRGLSWLGSWRGQTLRFDAIPCPDRCAVLVQSPAGGPVLAVAQEGDR